MALRARLCARYYRLYVPFRALRPLCIRCSQKCQCQCQSNNFNVDRIAELLRSPRRRSRVTEVCVGKDWRKRSVLTRWPSQNDKEKAINTTESIGVSFFLSSFAFSHTKRSLSRWTCELVKNSRRLSIALHRLCFVHENYAKFFSIKTGCHYPRNLGL